MIRSCFYTFVIKPILLVLLGLNVRHLERLRADGPHLIAANHNSHLDALVLMSLLGFSDVPKVRLVAAKDYWCRNRLMTWFSLNLIGVIPIDRKKEKEGDPILPIIQALDEGYTVVMFPEGSRGEPEKMQPLKFGIAKILEQMPGISVTPVFMYGLGKALPRGEGLLVPFVCEVNVGNPLEWNGDRAKFIMALGSAFSDLEKEIAPKNWR